MVSDCEGFLEIFYGGHPVAKCSCKICRNYRFLTQGMVQVHLCKKGFMLNVWRRFGHAEGDEAN
jgi:hypothetical protein